MIKKKSHRSDIERNKLIKNGKRIGIDEIIKQNKIININLKSEVKILQWNILQNNGIILFKV